MPLEPTFTFTIPSIHDGIPLDCRLYHPPHSVLSPLNTELSWNPRGAIVAHPYAPLGGCYDDPVVLAAVTEILKQGFVVATFNFRGAGTSKGRTSWQAKHELQDYISVAGFFIHYITGLGVSSIDGQNLSAYNTTLTPPTTSPGPSSPQEWGTTLILSGYSYGSLITTQLPPMIEILQRFENVTKGSAEAEIRLRAIRLAAQWHRDALLYRQARDIRRGPHEKLLPAARTRAIAVGGDECEPGTRRPSHESRRSLDSVRRSVDRGRKKLFRQRSSDASEDTLLAESLMTASVKTPRTCYLLISPLLPPISMFATMFSNRSDGGGELHKHPTLAVYGDKDFFTSQKKLRRWAEYWKGQSGSQFHFHEVVGAGHFWREEGAEQGMRLVIREWVQEIDHSLFQY